MLQYELNMGYGMSGAPILQGPTVRKRSSECMCSADRRTGMPNKEGFGWMTAC